MPPHNASVRGRSSRGRRQVVVPLEPGGMQDGQGRAPRMTDGRIAARKRKCAEVGAAAKSVTGGDEELASLDRAVAAETGAIEADADESFRGRGDGIPMLGEQGRRMRLMVLDSQERDTVACGEPRRPLG